MCRSETGHRLTLGKPVLDPLSGEFLELRLDHLAGRRLRQRRVIDDENVTWHLESGEALARIGQDLLLADTQTRGQHDPDAARLAPPLVRNADGKRLCDRRMAFERVLHLLGCNELAT